MKHLHEKIEDQIQGNGRLIPEFKNKFEASERPRILNKMDELEMEAKKVCESKGLDEKETSEILMEMSRRSVVRSFKGMPEQLVFGFYRLEIDQIRDYGRLNPARE
jgi:hypothetical protein